MAPVIANGLTDSSQSGVDGQVTASETESSPIQTVPSTAAGSSTSAAPSDPPNTLVLPDATSSQTAFLADLSPVASLRWSPDFGLNSLSGHPYPRSVRQTTNTYGDWSDWNFSKAYSRLEAVAGIDDSTGHPDVNLLLSFYGDSDQPLSFKANGKTVKSVILKVGKSVKIVVPLVGVLRLRIASRAVIPGNPTANNASQTIVLGDASLTP
jgi:hypothetical protein